MTPFDPAAATAAYLATISPAAQARATAYTQGGHWILLGGTLVTVAACFLIVKSGILSRLSQTLQKKKPRPLLTSFLCAGLFIVIDTVIELPWTWYSGLYRETAFGLSHESLSDWLGELLLNTVLSALMIGLFMLALYALIRKAPKTWWAWGGGLAAIAVVVLMLIAPVAIEPLFNDYKPAPAGAVRDAVVALARETGTPPDKIYIYNGSKQSDRYTANVSGLFGSARVALSDTMFRQGANIPEIRAVVGHEMGHYRLGHVFWGTGFTCGLAVAGFWLMAQLFPAAARLFGANPVIADPSGFPVFVALLTVLGLLATPLQSSMTRITEAQADAYSFEHAREPDGFARAMLKTAEYRAATPSAIEEFLFYDHPSVGRRIRAAMDWKAAHR